ncbi:MAG TPA: S8 family peptidase [Rhizomicrobium sp.]
MAGVAFAGVLSGTADASSTPLLRLSLADTESDGQSIDPFYGKINPFYGKINPFYGKINPFYGKISPFWGDVTPFWGNIDPFEGTPDPFFGSVDPFWGNISPYATNPFWKTVLPYWQSAGPQWGTLNTTWSNLQAANATDYTQLAAQLNAFFAQSATFWGPQVQKATGQDFNDGFADAMFAKYGIDPNDPSSLANVSADTRSAFFLDWYDGLMSFTGVDHLDWWMPAVHWSPELSQIQGANPVVVGVLDATVNAGQADVNNLQFVGGYQLYVNDHGAAVASLIAGAQDGQGVMGVAPNSVIHLYNPFDATGTASWSDVASGISALAASGAHVVNASLGVPGTVLSPEWVDILSGSLLSNRSNSLVVVKAAGNEGVTQTANVPWLLTLQVPNNLILVGSVNPNNTISSFSNTPGESCFTLLGICLEQNKLKYRFIVAPGELMLVSDNHGGTIRLSGTSFAAPLVTGAVALLQARWPWLQQHAAETVQIILQSADDLGAPGVDPVYGYGMLDIQASQSPLNFNNLMVYQPTNYTGAPSINILPNWSAKSLKASALNAGQLKLWQNSKAYVVAFETIGLTYRDFEIPLSSLLVGKNQSVNGNSNPFQSYLYQEMIDWANGRSSLGFNAQSMQVERNGWSLNFTATQSTQEEIDSGKGPFQSDFVATNRDAGLAFRFGQGNAAHAFFGDGALSLHSDFDPASGGVDPILGLASGGAYAKGSITVVRGLDLSFGVTQKSDDHEYIDPTFGPQQTMPLATYRATASVAGAAYKIADGLKLNASYTQFDEGDGLLGAQGGGAFDLAGGSKTDATTVGLDGSLGGGWSLSGSATSAHTSAQSFGQSLLTLTKGGLDSTAWELAANKLGIFGALDSVRLSLAQPLHVDNGALQYQSIQVVDRDTGALAPVSQTWSVGGYREYRLEAVYDAPVLDGLGSVEGFAMADSNAPTRTGTQTPLALTAGARFNLRF